eukprot:jgi/Picre1/29089/NNA_004482.t1
MSNVSSALRQMSQARHVGKIVVSASHMSQREDTGTENAIVITGGMGTLGFQVANWAASQNMLNIVLLGRTGRPTTGSPIDFSCVSDSIFGSMCTSTSCDTSTRADTSKIYCSKLLGIVHAGGVLRDGTIGSQTIKSVAQVFGAKG